MTPFIGKRLQVVVMLVNAAVMICAAGAMAGEIKSGQAAEEKVVSEQAAAVPGVTRRDADNIEKQWGVKIIGVRMSASRRLVDFRYKVVEPEKAASIMKTDAKPYLIEEAGGAKLEVPNDPNLGSLRSLGKPQTGKVYYILFSNWQGQVQTGSRITVVVGDFKAEHLLVE